MPSPAGARPRAGARALGTGGDRSAAAHGGVEVVAHDHDPGTRRRRSRRGGALSARWDDALLDGVELVVKSPGVPGDSGAGRGRPRARHPGDLRDRARRAAAPEPALGGHRHEREDDDHGAARGDPRGGAIAGRGGGEHRPAADVARRRAVAATRGSCASCRRSSSRTSRRCDRGWRCSSTSSRTTSTGTARFDAYAAAKLRVFENQRPDDVAVVPRGFGAVPGAGRRIEFAGRRPASGRAAHPAAPTTGRTPPPPPPQHGRSASPDTRSPKRSARSPVSSTGSRPSPSSAASSTSTIRRRRTWPRHCARWRRSRSAGCT